MQFLKSARYEVDTLFKPTESHECEVRHVTRPGDTLISINAEYCKAKFLKLSCHRVNGLYYVEETKYDMKQTATH